MVGGARWGGADWGEWGVGGIVTVENIKCIAKSNNILNLNRYV